MHRYAAIDPEGCPVIQRGLPVFINLPFPMYEIQNVHCSESGMHRRFYMVISKKDGGYHYMQFASKAGRDLAFLFLKMTAEYYGYV